MSGEVEIVASDATWPTQFTAVEHALRPVVGPEVVAIDHVGSTAVPGLAAWPRACSATTPSQGFPRRLTRGGKRFAREPPGSRRTNVHVRVAGRPNARYALLFP